LTAMLLSYPMTLMTRTMTQPKRHATVMERKRQVTRDVVLDAVVDVVRDGGFDFSVQEVADRAGLAHRTVYRHFPTREALIDGIAERFEASFAERGFTEGDTIDEVVDRIGARFAWFDSESDLVHAVAVKTLATGQRTPPSRRRGERMRALIREKYPNLPADETEAAFVAMRALIGMIGWHLMTSDGVASDVAAQTVHRMAEVALADLESRDAEAAGAAAGR
jgi:AcrR family transcriptional regulator